MRVVNERNGYGNAEENKKMIEDLKGSFLVENFDYVEDLAL